MRLRVPTPDTLAGPSRPPARPPLASLHVGAPERASACLVGRERQDPHQQQTQILDAQSSGASPCAGLRGELGRHMTVSHAASNRRENTYGSTG